MSSRIIVVIVCAVIVTFTCVPWFLGSQILESNMSTAAVPAKAPSGEPGIYFYPTPQSVVNRMLELADVEQDDVVYDLGCGDGRIVVTAAEKFGAQGVGIDIDPKCVDQARENAADVADLVEIRQGDIFKADISGATVVALYLLPEMNVQLLPQLHELPDGARIVSHQFAIDGYPADELIVMPDQNGDGDEQKVYLWTTPLEPGEGFVKAN